MADDGNAYRWTDFYNGVMTVRLGGADWAVVALPKDLSLTIQTQIWGRLTQALGQYRVRTVDVQYSGHGDRASFTIRPYLNVREDGVEVLGNVVSASFGISVGYEAGERGNSRNRRLRGRRPCRRDSGRDRRPRRSVRPARRFGWRR